MIKKGVRYFKTRLSSRGRITLPYKIRELLYLDKGSKMFVHLHPAGLIIIEPVDRSQFLALSEMAKRDFGITLNNKIVVEYGGKKW